MELVGGRNEGACCGSVGTVEGIRIKILRYLGKKYQRATIDWKQRYRDGKMALLIPVRIGTVKQGTLTESIII